VCVLHSAVVADPFCVVVVSADVWLYDISTRRTLQLFCTISVHSKLIVAPATSFRHISSRADLFLSVPLKMGFNSNILFGSVKETTE